MNVGERVVSFSSLDSTNAYALRNSGELVSGTVIWALEQRAGYGRLKREWVSDPGGLWFSVIFRPISIRDPGAYLKLFSCAVIRVFEQMDIPLSIKWPNDFLLHGRKLGGVLAESITSSGRVETVVIGVGINVNNDLPDALKMSGISLKEYSGRHYELSALLQMILRQSDNFRKKYLTPQKLRYLTRLWRSELSTVEGDMVYIQLSDRTVKGVVKKIRADSIELDCNDETISITNGDLLLQPR